jgi:hypothetical protein
MTVTFQKKAKTTDIKRHPPTTEPVMAIKKAITIEATS